MRANSLAAGRAVILWRDEWCLGGARREKLQGFFPSGLAQVEAAAVTVRLLPPPRVPCQSLLGGNLLRPLTKENQAALAESIPVVGPAGSAMVFDGRLWHCNYERSVPGERVLLHATYCRLAYRPLEDYGPVANALIARHGDAMADLLGKNLWYGNRAIGNGGVDMSKYMTTWAAARR